MALLFVLTLLASHEQLTGTIQLLLLPLTHLNRVDRLHGDSGLDITTVGAALAREWQPPFQGHCSASDVTGGTCLEKPAHLRLWRICRDGARAGLDWLDPFTTRVERDRIVAWHLGVSL